MCAVRLPFVRPHCPSGQSGFTFVELMITLAIAIILVAIAVPQYTSFVKTQQSVSEINNLLDDMRYARTEALKEGQFVSLCVSSNGTGCTTGGWQAGWIIYANPGFTVAAPSFVAGTSILLRVQSGFTDSNTIASNPASTNITYNRDGFAVGVSPTTGQLFTLHNTPAVTAATRCLWVDVLGHQYIQTSGQAAVTGQGANLCS